MEQQSDSTSVRHLELKEALDFVSQQCDRDRLYFKHLFNWTGGAIGLIVSVAVAIGAFLIGRTLEDAKSLTNAEVQRMRGAVRERIEAEFQSERIRDTVRQVVANKAATELEPVIREEVVRRVAAEMQRLRPAIDRAVANETAQQIARRQLPRVLEDWERANMVGVLKARPQPKLYIDCAGLEESEPCSYARQYAEVFKKAGWKTITVRPIEKLTARSSLDFAVLTTGPVETPEPAIELIKQAFMSCYGYKIPVERDTAGPFDAPHLIIPLKSF